MDLAAIPATFWQTLGVAGPLVGILIFLLRQATDERRTTNKAFLEAMSMNSITLSNTQEKAALVLGTTQEKAALALTLTQDKATAALHDLATAIRETRQSGASEHERIIDAIGKLPTR